MKLQGKVQGFSIVYSTLEFMSPRSLLDFRI